VEQRNQEHQEEEPQKVCTPEIVFNGICNHYFVDIGKDPEGKGQAQCKHCPMGRYFTDEYEVIEGEIRRKG
jgi:hypothetical protein